MAKETKFIIGAAIATLLIIFGLALLIATKQKEVAEIPNIPVAGITASVSHFDLGNVPINGGVVTKEYELKNETGRDATLQKIVTSCMCTQAKVKVGEKETRLFGMEMNGDTNPLINVSVPKDTTFKVTVQFDPAAHGPAGVGPFDRVVWLTFSNPAGVNELTFGGTVTSQ